MLPGAASWLRALGLDERLEAKSGPKESGQNRLPSRTARSQARPSISVATKLDTVMASPIGACYISLMTYNAILAIECLVEDYGWDAVS